jgi:DNA-binding response OmpR family regulator
MIQEKTQRVADLAEQLSEGLMTPAIYADEIRAVLRSEFDGCNPARWRQSRDGKHRNPRPQRPLVDSSTFSVLWAGKTCPLRRTILFRLAERLARQPNQYIAADQLQIDMWDEGVKSPDTIRSAVRNLQRISRGLLA